MDASKMLTLLMRLTHRNAPFLLQAVDEGLHRRECRAALLAQGVVDLAYRTGAACPQRLHDLEVQGFVKAVLAMRSTINDIDQTTKLG